MISEVYNLQDYETALEEDPYYQFGQQILLDEITGIANDKMVRILEIGGGSGIFTEKLAYNLPNASIHVIEPDEEWFVVLKERTSKITEIYCEQNTLEGFTDTFYDTCCASFALHHIPYEKQSASIERISGRLKGGGYFLVLDKYIPDFANEFERQAGLKTYHGCFLTCKKQRNLQKTVEFEITSLESNLLKTGDYKISVKILEKICSNNFRLVKRIKIAPLGRDRGSQAKVFGSLREAGFSVNRDEERKIQDNLQLSTWGIFVHVFQKEREDMDPVPME